MLYLTSKTKILLTGDHIISPCVRMVASISKLGRIAPFIANPPPAYSNMHSRLVQKDRNLCLGKTAYFPGPAKRL